jgi:mRNA-degrading endonuclease RelE of RelBE toxin-antitoxin system
MKLQYRLSASKQLKDIGAKDIKKVQRKIHWLLDNPLEGKLLQGELKGHRCLRAWPLRIVYTFDPDSKTITIDNVDYRGDVYK